jgi:hypothetical protein
MLHMFHTNIASVVFECCICFCNDFSIVSDFFQVFQTHVSSVLSVFRHMSQMFYLDVSKVERMLHMLQWRQWLADNGLPQGFGSFLARRASPSPLPPLPSLKQFERDARGCGGPTSAWEVVAPVGLTAGTMLEWWPHSKLRFVPSTRTSGNRAAAGVRSDIRALVLLYSETERAKIPRQAERSDNDDSVWYFF